MGCCWKEASIDQIKEMSPYAYDFIVHWIILNEIKELIKIRIFQLS
jgi:hypothetical protein